jgi:quercetin 2,3-dioxygenase
VQVAQGTATLNGEELRPGDGVALNAGDAIKLTGTSDDAEVLVFDMAA